MFSRARLKKLKHKTKKGMMLRIRRTESQPEDPNFKHFLATLCEIKVELKDMYNNSCRIAAAGKKHYKYLEKLGGLGLSNEDVFSKEVEFLNKLEELVCSALGSIVFKDIKRLNELVLRYKTAKLKFETAHFKTVKNMRRAGMTVVLRNSDKIMKANKDLPILHKAYIASKWKLRSWRDMILSNLRSTIGTRIAELAEVSSADHHLLYCQYFKKRLRKTLEFCGDEVVSEKTKYERRATFSYRTKDRFIAGNLVRSFTAGVGLGIEDEKDTEHEPNDSSSTDPTTPQEDPDDEGAVYTSDKVIYSPSQTKDRTYSSGEEYFDVPVSPLVTDYDNSAFVSKMLSIISLPG